MIPELEAGDLGRRLEALSPQEMDALPYGVIKLKKDGMVEIFNATEARDSGRKKRPTVGLDFFRDVAPCMAGPDMRGRVEAAAARGSVDIEIGWTGDFDDPEGEIHIRAISAADGGLWLVTTRPEE